MIPSAVVAVLLGGPTAPRPSMAATGGTGPAAPPLAEQRHVDAVLDAWELRGVAVPGAVRVVLPVAPGGPLRAASFGGPGTPGGSHPPNLNKLDTELLGTVGMFTSNFSGWLVLTLHIHPRASHHSAEQHQLPLLARA